MIATISFVVFAGMLLAGAFLTAATRYLDIGAMGVLVAISGGLGLCVLLGAVWLALWLFVAAGIALAVLQMYLARGLARGATPVLWNRRSGRAFLGLLGATTLLQIILGFSGVDVVTTGFAASLATDPSGDAQMISGMGNARFELRDVLSITLALPLLLAGFIASRVMTDPGETRAKTKRLGQGRDRFVLGYRG